MRWLLWLVPGCGSPDEGPPSADPAPSDTSPSTATPTGQTGRPASDSAVPTDTGTPPAPCASSGSGTFSGPTTLVSTAVRCGVSGDQVEYSACTEGPSLGGWVYAQETGNPQPNWSDSHRLERVASDPQGWWDSLTRRLQTRASITTWETDVSTLFACGAHLEDPQVMTFAMMVFDEAGVAADCVVWGQDPEGLIGGTAPLAVSAPPFDLGRCRLLP